MRYSGRTQYILNVKLIVLSYTYFLERKKRNIFDFETHISEGETVSIFILTLCKRKVLK